MKKWNGLLLFGVIAALFTACQKSPNNSPYPQISFKFLTPDSVRAGLFSDTAYLYFEYTDGDGDLGKDPNSTSAIFLMDSRDSTVRQYPFPIIEAEEAHDPAYGMSGDCLVNIQAATLIPRPDTLHMTKGDTVRFTTYIVDEAGHESNRFTTPNLYIRPR